MSGNVVVHILTAPASGGAESFVRDLCIALKSRHWRAHVAFISSADDLGRDAGYAVDFLDRLDAAGVSYSYLGHECRRRPWLGAYRLRKLVGEIGAGLVHSHLGYGNVFAFAVPRTPLVYTHHSEQPRFSPATYGLFRRRVRAWIGISQTCAATLERHCRQPVRLIRNAVDLSRLPAPQPRQPDMPLRGIAVGRLSAQKNYPLLAEALRRVEANGPSRIKVDIFGEGDPGVIAQCAAILTACPDDLLRFMGASQDIPAEMAAHSLFLMSSAWEGMPVSLIEATASGLPAIVTDVGGCREIVQQCGSGLVVRPDDPDAFAAAIESLLTEAGSLARMSSNAIRHAPDFSIDVAAEAHRRLYSEILT